MNAFRDLMKIIKQILGEENMFKYKSTEVNQLYLMYMGSCKIFTTEYLHWETKLFWATSNIMGMVIAYGASILCLLYGDRGDLLMLLYVGFVASILTYTAFIIPLSMRWYASKIEAMLDHLDEIVTRRNLILIEQNRKPRYTNNLVTANISLSFYSYVVFNLICLLDIVFFYKPRKVKDYTFYLIPFPRLEEYGTREIFFTINILLTYSTMLYIIVLFAELKFFDIWARLSHNEALYICDDIAIASKDYETRYSKNETTISTNEKLLIDRKLIRNMIASLKGLEDIKT